MGDMLYLAEHDYTDVDAKVDLINGVLRLRRGSWIPQIGDVGGAPVVETMDLVSDEPNAALIAEITKMEGILEQARTWPINPVQSGGTWLEWGLDEEPRASAETGYPAKRAWIHDGKLQLSGAGGLPGPFLNQRGAGKLAVQRHPLWENLEPVNDILEPIAWGDAEDATGLLTEMGTAPARIERCYIEASIGATDDYQEFWVGFRSHNDGWSEFDPLWELEDGTNGTDTSDQSDGTASGGYHCQVTFATEAGLDERLSISTNQAHAGTTDWTDFNGRYMVLVRAKVGSSTECGLVLRIGAPDDENRARCEEVFIDNTVWKLIELGEMTLPPGGRREGFYPYGGNPQYTTLAIDAERLSGSGYLYLDALYLVPADHFLHGYCRDDASNLRLVTFTTPADEQEYRMNVKGVTNQHLASAEFMARDWVLPTDLAFAVAAGQNVSTGHFLGDSIRLELYWYPRWFLYRSA